MVGIRFHEPLNGFLLFFQGLELEPEQSERYFRALYLLRHLHQTLQNQLTSKGFPIRKGPGTCDQVLGFQIFLVLVSRCLMINVHLNR